jgi:hypothetical protein
MSERKARTIIFDEQITIITGDNDTGKSSLVKSIFRCFGAEPQTHDAWARARVTGLLHFTVAQQDLAILRQGSIFTVFDRRKEILGQFQSITNELGPFLANLLKFGLKLQGRNDGQSITPPPAFYFLPFYFDQDRSWNKSWDSFVRLDQMSKWKLDLVEYHTGIKPNEFYELKGRQALLQKQRDQAQMDLDVVRRIRDELSDQLQTLSFNVDLDAFRDEITELIVECEKIQKTADKVRDRLVTLHNERISLEAQSEIVKSSLSELDKDYVFLQKADSHVTCPVCNAVYENNFGEVFEIALDEDKCEDLLNRINDELWAVRKKIEAESAKHQEHEVETAKIRALLAKKKEQVELKDLIEGHSKRQVKEVLQGKLAGLNNVLFEAEALLSNLKHELNKLISKERRKEITDMYRSFMRRYLLLLAVPSMADEAHKRVLARITEQGSDLPRALLAYGFSILQTMRKYSTSVFAPIIIDSPIQQEQDKVNHVRILEFIRDHRPADVQLVVGVVDTKGVDFGGKIINLQNEKRSVLVAEEYAESLAELEQYTQKSLIFIDGRRAI